MTLYDGYLDLEPTSWGHEIQMQRAIKEWNIICQSHDRVNGVLEIGPGHGVFAELIRSVHCSYVALEANHRIARGMAEKGYRVCESSVPPFALASSSVDVVYAAHVIEHMPDPKTALYFAQEAERVLKPGGVLYLCGPDLMAFGRSFWDADYTHCFPVTEWRLRQLLSDSQLELLSVIYFAGPTSGALSYGVSLLVRLLPGRLFLLPHMARVRIRRLKMTFMRNVGVLARKPSVSALPVGMGAK